MQASPVLAPMLLRYCDTLQNNCEIRVCPNGFAKFLGIIADMDSTVLA